MRAEHERHKKRAANDWAARILVDCDPALVTWLRGNRDADKSSWTGWRWTEFSDVEFASFPV